jgi:hypothetical protein
MHQRTSRNAGTHGQEPMPDLVLPLQAAGTQGAGVSQEEA